MKTEIALVQTARENAMQTHRSGDALQKQNARIEQRAADAANEVAECARSLVARLNEAIQRIEAASTTQEAWLAASWLRVDTWDRMLRATTQLETLNEIAR